MEDAALDAERADTAITTETPACSVGELFRSFWPYTRGFRLRIALTFALIVTVPALDTAAIWQYKNLIDRVIVPHDLGAFAPVAATFFAIQLLAGAAAYADRYLSTAIGERFLLELRSAFFRRLQALPLAVLDRRRLGDLLSRLTSDISAIETFVVSGIGSLLAYSARIVFFSAMLLYLSWQLALAAFVVAPFFLIASRVFTRRIRAASRERRRRVGTTSAVAEESLAKAVLVQAYGREETEHERFQRESHGSFEAALTTARLRAAFSPLLGILESVAVLSVAALGTWQIAQGSLTIGGLLVFMTYLGQLYGPVRRIGSLGNDVFAASASAERVLELMRVEPSPASPPHGRRLLRPRGHVVFDAVSFRYPGAASDAISDVVLEAAPGRLVAVVGATGAGKSTLARLLLRFYDPTSGAVLLDGHDLRELDLPSLRSSVAVVLQETLVFDGTIGDNIAYGRAGATREEIVAAAKAADAHGFVSALPAGYDTRVGQNGRLLSGGQRQRIALARAFVRDAPILLLDEPTTGLDADTADRTMAALGRLMEDRTTIMISHNLATTRAADTVLVMEGGRVTSAGPHADLLRSSETYRMLHALHLPAPAAPAWTPA